MKRLFIYIAVGLLFTLSASAKPYIFKSGTEQVSLIELYTSEGCSSCPPADNWLSLLKRDPRLWKQLIPLAFHVDYWDQIGWPDRFAEAEFSDRQRRYANTANLSGVYTPGLLLNGHEWRGWYRRSALTGSSFKTSKITGELILQVSENDVEAIYTSPQPFPFVKLNIAVLGFDLETPVTRGENRGRVLKHDFVVLGFKQLIMPAESLKYEMATRLPTLKVEADKKAVVAWVNSSVDMTPLQATGGWITQ